MDLPAVSSMTCERRRAAVKEWPPRSKKLSVMLTDGKPRTFAKMVASCGLQFIAGATTVAGIPVPEGAKAKPADRPYALVVIGNPSNATNLEGTMCSGSLSLSSFLEAVVVQLLTRSGDQVPDEALVPRVVLAQDYHGLSDPGALSYYNFNLAKFRCESREVSPGHQSGPGTQYSILEKASQVAGFVQPGVRCLAKRVGINFCAVRSGRFRYPRANPIPPICSSPATPIGTG